MNERANELVRLLAEECTNMQDVQKLLKTYSRNY